MGWLPFEHINYETYKGDALLARACLLIEKDATKEKIKSSSCAIKNRTKKKFLTQIFLLPAEIIQTSHM